MNRTSIITIDTFKTIGQGALGAVTFGAYHQYTTNKIMELNNENMVTKHNQAIDKMETKHKNEMKEMDALFNEKINKLEKIIETKQNSWYFRVY